MSLKLICQREDCNFFFLDKSKRCDISLVNLKTKCMKIDVIRQTHIFRVVAENYRLVRVTAVIVA